MTATGIPDPEACYRAALGRDPRFDGRFYLAVATTGIYCRPSCPAAKPLRANCRFYLTAAAAVAAGFRACKRCRPDALPGSRQWDVRGDLAARAVRMVTDGVVDEVGVAGLAARLHVSERHLHRVLVEEVGAAAHQLNRTRRAQTARLLIEQTPLRLGDVAFAAGFASVRQFNDVLRQEFGAPPSALRRPAGPAAPAGPGAAVVLRLKHRQPFAGVALRTWLAAHTVPGLDRIDTDGRHTRYVPAPHGPARVSVAIGELPDAVTVRLEPADLADLPAVVTRMRRWLDLDADPELVATALGRDPLLAPLVTERPGLRVPGAVDGVETAVLAVLGQQVSLAAARTYAARLVAAYGSPKQDGLSTFPSPDVLAAAGPDAVRDVLRVPAARARTVHGLAVALAGGLRLDPGADRTEARAALLALPGIGPWTAEYVALRTLGDPDAFPAGDLILRRRLGVRTAREAAARAAAWSPWRGYALMHLWTSYLSTGKVTP